MRYASRRERLLSMLQRPVLLFAGGFIPRNYQANAYPYRADSTFLYFFERPEPGSAAFFDPAVGTVTLFLPERTLEDSLWHGSLETFEAARERHGVTAVFAVEGLEGRCTTLGKGRQILSLAVSDEASNARARGITGEALRFDEPSAAGRPELLDALASLRLIKSEEEVAELRRLVPITREGHELAMRHSRVGATEQLLAGHVEGAFARSGCVPGYSTILSVRGEVLHNHGHENALADGDLVLLDAGAEGPLGYCNDVTRCWPVTGRFSPEAKDVYELVLAAELAAIAAVKPGARYRDLHLRSARVIAEGLVAMGLLKGSPEGLVESGAHALFFPHGVGHQLGLDVHDLETFGDRIHYPGGRTRSTQFGTAFLRMDMDLREGMTFTIEPGVYFVPAILRSKDFRQKFASQVAWDRAETFLSMNQGRGFGGIRIEDDVLCADKGPEVLTASIPKTVLELEAIVGRA